MLVSKYSFKFLSRAEVKNIRYSLRLAKQEARANFQTQLAQVKTAKIKQAQAQDASKRSFLKLAGLVGLGVFTSSLIPKKAKALVFGSEPASSVVGVKDSANVRINPAKEDGNLATIAGKDFATQTTLALIKTNSDKFNFDGTDLKVVSSGGPGGASNVGILNTTSTQVNPATEDSLILLRRMVKLMESQATVDAANRQRITLDAWGTSVLLGTGTSANCPRVGLGTDSTVGTVTSVTNVATVGLYAAQQMYGDVAHDVYANALRRHLTFS